MFWSATRHAEKLSIAVALKKLLPKELPPSLYAGPGRLDEILARTPRGGVGSQVHPVRWSHKQIKDSWWLVTRSTMKCEGKHGKAWGILYWKGKRTSEKERPIPGILKYTWAEGSSVPTEGGK
ncbi:hypothetical protein C8J56DRAFT_781674 [Mycena floridula]|nr:hypothetical protein C8J56DRAFT_781674 [Mycena floridula]